MNVRELSLLSEEVDKEVKSIVINRAYKYELEKLEKLRAMFEALDL